MSASSSAATSADLAVNVWTCDDPVAISAPGRVGRRRDLHQRARRRAAACVGTREPVGRVRAGTPGPSPRAGARTAAAWSHPDSRRRPGTGSGRADSMVKAVRSWRSSTVEVVSIGRPRSVRPACARNGQARRLRKVMATRPRSSVAYGRQVERHGCPGRCTGWS